MTTSITIIQNDPTQQFEVIAARRDLASTTRYRYGREIQAAIHAGIPLFDAQQLAIYADTLPTSRKGFLRAAVNLLASEVAQAAKAQATPENIHEVQAVLWRTESLRDAIHVKQPKGQKAHTWLNLAEVKRLVRLPDMMTLIGLRDRLVLGLLLGAGLRRDELVNLEWEHIKKQGERVVISLTGKGNKRRMIPISEKLAQLLDEWWERNGRSSGLVIRSVAKGGRLGNRMSGQAVLDMVQKYGRMIDKEELRPHDLRRTYARIGYDAGIDIGQISKLLGHASIKTTQQYLGIEVDTKKTVSDFVPV